MLAKELKKKYLDFFKKKQHAIIPSAPLVPTNDSSVLFNTAGMQPLVPYLSGMSHPLGKRLANVQKCLRTVDFDNIGDNAHHTFFQMLGNWSLGDYFKKEAIAWSFEFLTGKEELNLALNQLAFTVYEGDAKVPRDEESFKLWQERGIPKERIAYVGRDNFWIAGETGPCGPSTEMFYWTGERKAPKKFDPTDDRWVEIWNDVFMMYEKKKEGTIIPLKQRNVDTGMGLERTLAVLNGKKSAYETDLFLPIIKKLEQLSGKPYSKHQREMRIVVDHLRAAVFILGDEVPVLPSNVDRGYVLRRLIRRAVRYGKLLALKSSLVPLAEATIQGYKQMYPELEKNKAVILDELKKEEDKFDKTLEIGLKEFEKMAAKEKLISGKEAFLLFQSYGFPLELTEELADEKKIKVDVPGFLAEQDKHKELSRTGAEKKFKGGLADLSSETIKLHTATHLLNEALRKIISSEIKQRGSNITPERLRFDFNFARKLTAEEIKRVEDEVNKVVKQDLKVVRKEMAYKEAVKLGAQAEFGQKYPERVSIYLIGDYSKELCGGPHVEHTLQIGVFRIIKEEAIAAGVRRIKAVVGNKEKS